MGTLSRGKVEKSCLFKSRILVNRPLHVLDLGIRLGIREVAFDFAMRRHITLHRAKEADGTHTFANDLHSVFTQVDNAGVTRCNGSAVDNAIHLPMMQSRN
jgi:hypothetical protein